MTEELEQLLKNLKLRDMLAVYDEQLRAAEKGQVSHSEFVAGLLRAQWHQRQDSALEWRIRRANLPERWSLEKFPYARQPGIHRKQNQAVLTPEHRPMDYFGARSSAGIFKSGWRGSVEL